MTERRKRLRTSSVLVILAALALVALWCDINAGYRSISLEELGQILSGTASQSLTYTLVDLRLPRVLTSLLVGVGLSLSGCLLQGVSRNDMADPGVLGINAGAGLLVAAFIVFVPAGLFPSAAALPVLAFAGSAAVAFLGWRLSVVRGASSPRRLLLIGVALATGLSSATSLLMLRMSDGDYAFVQNWIAGSIWGASWENVAILAVGLALLVAGALYASRTLNVLGSARRPPRDSAWMCPGPALPSPPWPWGPRGSLAPWAAASLSLGSFARIWRGASWGRTSGPSCPQRCSWAPCSCFWPTSSRARCSPPTRFPSASWRRSSVRPISCTCWRNPRRR